MREGRAPLSLRSPLLVLVVLACGSPGGSGTGGGGAAGGGVVAAGGGGTTGGGTAVVDSGAPDAGLPDDAGAADAGAEDAGGLDAGLVDAGGVDAGLVDAGALDAGEGTDGGGGDGGPPDAGSPDGGPADAGPSDAGWGDPPPTVPVDPRRASWVTGHVVSLAGAPLSGVAVRGLGAFAGHGTARSDSNGDFALEVNGGGLVSVEVSAPGYIMAQRQVVAPWRAGGDVGIVTLVPVDSKSTTVTFDGNPTTRIVHQSTPVVDADGSRRATLVFAGHTTATVVQPDGTQTPLTGSLTVRATEFSKPSAMPAPLPSRSGFTYCTELSVDGVDPHATVQFSAPVVVWVDNFLHFPSGERVPVGYYDRNRAVWVPSDDGRVVTLLDANADGTVDGVDANHDGLPDDLTGDGTTTDEVAGFASASGAVPGATFWRFLVDHFTPWDGNWPYDFPANAKPPPTKPPTPRTKNPCEGAVSPGSTFSCESGVLEQDIPIPGTPVTLHYSSDQTSGHRSAVDVRATGDTVPASLQGIDVTMQVGDRVYRSTAPLAPSQYVHFDWDGKDAKGNPLPGKQTAKVRVAYHYPLDYTRTNAGANSRAFGAAGVGVIGNRATAVGDLYQDFDVALEAPSAPPLATGWTVSGVHRLDPATNTVFRGDGSRQHLGELQLAKIPAFSRLIGTATRVGPDGNLYYIANAPYGVRRVTLDGTDTMAFGGGTIPYPAPDGTRSVDAQVHPWEFEILPDGSIVFIEFSGTNNTTELFRRIGPDGILRTIASFPDNLTRQYNWVAQTFDVAPDGTIHFAGQTGFFELKPDGRVSPSNIAAVSGVAGTVTVGPDGTLYRLEGGFFGRVRAIHPNGTNVLCTTYFTNATRIVTDGQGRVYISASGDSTNTVTWAGGGIYLWDGTTAGAKRISGSFGENNSQRGSWPEHGMTLSDARMVGGNMELLPGVGLLVRAMTFNGPSQELPWWKLAAGGTLQSGLQSDLPDDSGDVAHRFDPQGLHTATVDLITRVKLTDLQYASGQLVGLTDRFGGHTTFERDGSAVAVAVVGPDGLRTSLSVQNGLLTGITFADGTGYTFGYSPGGLMTSKLDPTGAQFRYGYDPIGQFTSATDAVGGVSTLSLAMTDGGLLSTHTDQAGRVTVHQLATGANDSSTRTKVAPSGAISTVQATDFAQGTVTTFPNGTSETLSWGSLAGVGVPMLSSASTSVPSVGTRVVTRDGTWTDSNGDGVPEAVDLGTTINGRRSHLLRNVAAGTITRTTAAGRTSVITYDPVTLLQSKVTSPRGTVLAKTYDPRGRPLTVSRSGPGETTRTLTYTWGANGQVATVTDAAGQVTTLGYDALNRVNVITSPSGASTKIDHDALGRPTTVTTPNGAIWNIGYTAVGLMNQLTLPDAGSGANVATWSYDLAKALTSASLPDGRTVTQTLDDAGRPAVLTTDFGDEVMTWDSTGLLASATRDGVTLTITRAGRLPMRQTWSGAVTGDLRLGYDTDLRLAHVTLAGVDTPLSYDSDGLVTNSGDLALTRNAASGLTERVTLGTTALQLGSDGFGATSARTVTSGMSTLYSSAVTRDALGRLSTNSETISGVSHTWAYHYDLDGHLASVDRDGAPWGSWTWDADGNRLTTSVRGVMATATFDARDRLVAQGSVTYAYGAAGDLRQKSNGLQTTKLTHEATGALRTVELPTGRRVDYVLDGLSRRVGKKVDGTLAKAYLYLNQLQPVAELDGTGTVVSRFVYTEPQSPPAYMLKAGKKYLFVTDDVGSVRLVIDSATGAIAQQLTYDPFGNVLSDSSPGFQPFGFGGGVYDVDTGLVHLGARDYDPETGRWTSADPMGFRSGETNLYAYAEGDPVNHADPTGYRSSGRGSEFFGDTTDLTMELGAKAVANAESAGLDDLSNARNWRENYPDDSPEQQALSNIDRYDFVRVMSEDYGVLAGLGTATVLDTGYTLAKFFGEGRSKPSLEQIQWGLYGLLDHVLGRTRHQRFCGG